MTTNTSEEGNPSPICISICLLFAMLMCSSAATAFDILTSTHKVPPFLAAFWRLFLQNCIQFIPFVQTFRDIWRRDRNRRVESIEEEWRRNGLALSEEHDGIGDVSSCSTTTRTTNNDDDDNNQTNKNENEEKQQTQDKNESIKEGEKMSLLLPRYYASIPLMLLSGAFLGVHFSAWVDSLRLTSMTHSLLWVSTGPIILNSGSWLLYGLGTSTFVARCVSSSILNMMKIDRPSLFETMGAITGIIGGGVILLDVRKDHDESEQEESKSRSPTFYGDAVAFIGALAVCLYLVIGRNLRSWVPLWLYIFPVIGAGALMCLLFSILDTNDPITWSGNGPNSVFGFVNREYIGYAFYLAIGPGILGHTMLNYLLKYISPLIVSTAMLSEPVLGSIIGSLFGMQTLPGKYTWIGGIILLFGLFLIVSGENSEDGEIGIKDEAAEESKKRKEENGEDLNQYSGSIQTPLMANGALEVDGTTSIRGETYGSI